MSIKPSTSSKCIIYTTKGRIDVELWAREFPTTTLAFLRSCQGQKLQRLDCVRSDGTVTLAGGTPEKTLDIEGHVFGGHCSRGSVGYDRTINQWFFASEGCAVDESQWMIIGKIVGESNYISRRIVSESQLKEGGKFEYPPLIKKVEVTIPYFELREIETAPSQEDRKPSVKKNSNPKVRLSYEEEDDEEEIVPLKKIKPPPGIKDNAKIDSALGDLEKPESQLQGEMSAREKETLSILFKFQQRQKGRHNVLNHDA